MTCSHRGCVVLLLLTSFCVNLGAVAGQTGGPLPEPGVPERIEICENPKVGFLKYHHCGTLIWNGQNYDATFLPLIGPGEIATDTGAVGTITMLRAGNSVTFSRIDSIGTEGSASYRGTIVGNTASGTVTWFHPLMPNFKGTWTATFFMAPAAAPDPPSPTPTETVPSVGDRVELCEQPIPNPQNLRNCGILTWNSQKYDVTWSGVWNGASPQTKPGSGVIMCERKDDAVTMNRVDVTGIPGITAVYHGTIGKEDTVSGTVTWFMNGTAFATGTWEAKPKAP